MYVYDWDLSSPEHECLSDVAQIVFVQVVFHKLNVLEDCLTAGFRHGKNRQLLRAFTKKGPTFLWKKYDQLQLFGNLAF